MASNFLAAELSRTATMKPPPVFSESVEFFSGFSTIMDFWQGLDQVNVPLLAHAIETTAEFEFISSPHFVFSGYSREIFGFKAHPAGPFLFNTRDIIAILGLQADFLIYPAVIGLDYRHDCKHGIRDNIERDLIHDAFGFHFRPAMPIFFPTFGGKGIADFRLELEANVPPIFQQAQFDIDRFRATMEGLIIPMFFGSNLHFVLEGRIAGFYRTDTLLVDIKPGIYWDWRIVLGLETFGKMWDLRLYTSLERISDEWYDSVLEPAIVPVFGILLKTNFYS